MANPPFLSISKSKCFRTGEKEDTPAIKGSMGLSHGKITMKKFEDFCS
jgi:hypothetical protein